MLKKSKSKVRLPTEQEFQFAQDLVRLVEPIVTYQEYLGGDNYITASLYMKAIRQVYDKVLTAEEQCPASNTKLASLIRTLKEDYEGRWVAPASTPNSYKFLQVACPLDPRFAYFLQFCFMIFVSLVRNVLV